MPSLTFRVISLISIRLCIFYTYKNGCIACDYWDRACLQILTNSDFRAIQQLVYTLYRYNDGIRNE